jgi:hypothetical protein
VASREAAAFQNFKFLKNGATIMPEPSKEGTGGTTSTPALPDYRDCAASVSITTFPGLSLTGPDFIENGRTARVGGDRP